MYNPKSREEIGRNMSAIRSVENRTETALRKELHRRGLRYRKYVPKLLGKPDIVFTKAKVVIFVDGDYWHGRVLREGGEAALRERMKTSNRDYWMAKLRRNVARDDHVSAELARAGWKVIRLWESDVKRDIPAAADFISSILTAR